MFLPWTSSSIASCIIPVAMVMMFTLEKKKTRKWKLENVKISMKIDKTKFAQNIPYD